MARRGRLHVARATYFVVIRFQSRLCVLAPIRDRTYSDADLRLIHATRHAFEQQLGKAVKHWFARVHAHCLLPDSALLLMEIAYAPLDQIMRGLLGQFSRQFHRRTGTAGTPYAGRYDALMIDTEEFLLDFARYIFWSPVRAGLCRTPQEYPYSSIRAWYGGTQPSLLPGSAVLQEIVLRYGPVPHGLGRFLQDKPTPGFGALQSHGSLRDRRIAGRAYFVRAIQQKLSRRRNTSSPDRAIAWARSLVRQEIAERPLPRRTSTELLARSLAAWLLTRGNIMSLARIARDLHVAPSTLHSEIRRYSKATAALFSSATLSRFLEYLDTVELDDDVDSEITTSLPGEDHQ